MRSRDAIDAAANLLDAGVATHTFPAAVAEIGDSRGVLWSEAFGSLTFDDGAARTTTTTIFDLASITKPLATTSVVLQLCAAGAVALDTPLADLFPQWRGDDRRHASVQDALEHCSGLPPRLVDRPPHTRREFEHDICAIPLEAPPRHRAIYSDLDFILLGFLAADRGACPLDAQFAALRDTLFAAAEMADAEYLGYGVREPLRAHTAPTLPLPADRRAPRQLAGEVHDDYAAALGGVAGHAGLFGTAAGVGRFARLALRGARGDRSVPAPLSPQWMTLARRRSAVARSSRALGWDTMLPTSSCGAAMSVTAFGHVGFTGTSLWIDPDRDRYFVLLTNRVCGGGTSDEMQQVRRAFHDALGAV